MEQAVRTSRSRASGLFIHPAPARFFRGVVAHEIWAIFLADLLGLGVSGRGMGLTLGNANQPPPPEFLQD